MRLLGTSKKENIPLFDKNYHSQKKEKTAADGCRLHKIQRLWLEDDRIASCRAVANWA